MLHLSALSWAEVLDGGVMLVEPMGFMHFILVALEAPQLIVERRCERTFWDYHAQAEREVAFALVVCRSHY